MKRTICIKSQDHYYIVQPQLSPFSTQVIYVIVIYVSDFVATNLLKILKCEICSFALTDGKTNFHNTFLDYKNQNFQKS